MKNNSPGLSLSTKAKLFGKISSEPIWPPQKETVLIAQDSSIHPPPKKQIDGLTVNSVWKCYNSTIQSESARPHSPTVCICVNSHKKQHLQCHSTGPSNHAMKDSPGLNLQKKDHLHIDNRMHLHKDGKHKTLPQVIHTMLSSAKQNKKKDVHSYSLNY